MNEHTSSDRVPISSQGSITSAANTRRIAIANERLLDIDGG